MGNFLLSEEDRIEIRDISSAEEMISVEELQREVWQVPDIEVVPSTQLLAAIHAGGTLIGAFDGERAVGFAFGFPSFEDGIHAHHSHMLAVLPEYRRHDLGFRLKAAQRDRVLAQGIGMMSWTFDPLQSMNAHFNFAKLGVIAERYFVDFYGSQAASFLHQNGTDRLWVKWELNSERVNTRVSRKVPVSNVPNAEPILFIEGNAPKVGLAPLRDAVSVSIAIPSDIAAIEAHDMELARDWRKATGQAFTAALNEGFYVSEFQKAKVPGEFGTYTLRKK